MMTVISTIGGLLPIMVGHGTGSEMMKRIAAPMVGGYGHRHGFNCDRDPGHVFTGAGVSLQKTGLPLKPCLFPVGFLISILRYNTIHERQR